MTPIPDREPVGLIAAAHPVARDVFQRLGVDAVRWSGSTFADVCAHHGLEAGAVRAELESRLEQEAPACWESRPTPELVEHVVRCFHTPLIRLLPRLHVQLRESLKIFQGHGRRRLQGLVARFARYRAATETHIFKEEDVLFPWLHAGHYARALAPLHVVRLEHRQETWHLDELLRRAEACGEPVEARAAWARLLRELEALTLFQDAHRTFEDEVLFARALEHDRGRDRR